MIRTNIYNETWPDLTGVFDAPALMRQHERLLIYALVTGLRPDRVLEIGTDVGGTAWIMVQAMTESGHGRLVCVDPRPTAWMDVSRAAMSERAVLVQGRSPEALAACYQAAGGEFDLVLIDADHEYEAVLADIEGVLPYVRDGGRILVHDYLYPPTLHAIHAALYRHIDVSDGGILASLPILYERKAQGGLYSLLKRSSEF